MERINDQLARLIRNKFFLICVGVVSVLLIVSAILQALTVPPLPVETVVNTDKQLEAQLSFENIEVDIPSSLVIYLARTRPLDVREFANALSTQLSLAPHPVARSVWVNEQTDEALYLEDQDKFIGYSAHQVTDPFISLPEEQVNTIKNNLQTFIDGHQLFKDYVISDPLPIHVSTEGFELIENESEKPTGFQFSIYKTVNDIPYFPSDISDDLGTVWTDLSGRIIKIRFHPLVLELEEVESHTPLSVENIKNNMQNGLITYIKTLRLIADRDTSDSINTINFVSAQLEYRQNTDNGYLLPYLRFSGIGKDDNNQDYYVEAISPAVKVE